MRSVPEQSRHPGAVLMLPGSGSDDIFLHAAFDTALTAVGLCLRAHRPSGAARTAGDVIADYHRALDNAANELDGRLHIGGVSFGAHIAVQWAARNPGRCAGVLAVMPAYTGPADHAPAAVAARVSADAVRKDGLEQALARATSGVPAWLAAELTRAWPRHGAALTASLDAAATHPGPTPSELRRLTVPVTVVGCVGDPVHPVEVAREWASVIPRSVRTEITFDRLGADRAALGHAAAQAHQVPGLQSWSG